MTDLHYASDAIVQTVRGPRFGTLLVRALDFSSRKTSDGTHLSRYGWMFGSDIEVLSAIAMPTSGIRAPKGEEGMDVDVASSAASGGLSLEQTNLLLLGVALTAVIILAVVIYMHVKLRQAHALYEKDKPSLSKSGRALHKMFNSLASSAAQGIVSASTAITTAGTASSSSAGAAGVMGSEQQKEIEMSKMGLMDSRIDEDLED